MKIRLTYDPPPIPVRTMDYVASADEYSARGASPEQAEQRLIQDLLDLGFTKAEINPSKS